MQQATSRKNRPISPDLRKYIGEKYRKGIRNFIAEKSSLLMRKIRELDKVDLFFILVLPSFIWPIYFNYSKSIKNWAKKEINKISKNDNQ